MEHIYNNLKLFNYLQTTHALFKLNFKSKNILCVFCFCFFLYMEHGFIYWFAIMIMLFGLHYYYKK